MIFDGVIILISIITFLMLVLGTFCIQLWTRLFCAVFLGFIIGVALLPQIYSRLYEKKTVTRFTLVLSLISFIVAFTPLVSNDFNILLLDNVFDKQLRYNITDFFKNEDETSYIFGFDITAYDDIEKSPYIDKNEDLITLYNKYTSTQNNKNIKYREFCKARLCHDLERFHKLKILGKFSIYTIGEKSTKLLDGDFSKETDIEDAVQRLNEVPYNAEETHLKQYFDTIYSIVKNEAKPSINKFFKYVTFTYSDFVLDRNGKSIQTDMNYIRDISRRELPNLNIINNLFISPCDKINDEKEFCVVDFFEGSCFTKTKLIEITLDTEFGNSIHNKCERDTTCYFSEKEDVSPIFDLSDDTYSIKIHGRADLDNKISLTNIADKTTTYQLSSTKPQKIELKGQYAMRFANSNIESPVILDIACQDIHCLLTLNAEKNKHHNKMLRLVLIFALVFSSMYIPHSIFKFSVKIKNYEKRKAT